MRKVAQFAPSLLNRLDSPAAEIKTFAKTRYNKPSYFRKREDMRTVIFITGIALSFGLQAQGVSSAFDAESGRLEISNLELNGQVYYLELNLQNAETLSFSLDAASIVDITPSSTQAALVASDIVGTWDITGEANTFITFNSNGTYTQSQGSGVDMEACPNGGIETGTYRWTPETGLVRFSVSTDNNGSCGLSNAGRSLRFLIDGNQGTIQASDGGASLTRR